MPLGNINHKAKCALKIGYLTKQVLSNNNAIFKNVSNFIGIMGPILQFSCIFDEKNFISNILSLKGNYYLITDINYRYIQKTQHCYNLSSYASSAIGFYPEKEKNIEEAFKYGIYSYCF